MNKRGHSLVELMMVVGIIGVVGAAAVPDMMNRSPQRKLEQASWQIYMDLQQAKAQAVSENESVQISVDNTNGEYTIWADSNGNGTRETGETTVRKLVSDIPGIQLAAHPSTLTLNPSGTASSSYYYFYMRVHNSEAGYKYIYVFPNGYIDPLHIHQQ